MALVDILPAGSQHPLAWSCIVVLAELRDRFPALDSWVMHVQGLLDQHRVLLALEDEALNLACWLQHGVVCCLR